MRAWMLVFLLLIPFALAGEADPFVESGVLVATIVVGDDAPATDVLHGIDITNYLGSFADETPIGIAQIASKVDIEDGGVYILVGTPDDNELVKSYLDINPGDLLKGAYLELDGNIMIVSGRTAGDLSTAIELFRDGFRNSGSIVEAQVTLPDPEEVEEEEIEDEPEEVNEETEKPESETTAVPPAKESEPVEEVVEESDECVEELYCEGDILRMKTTSCSDVSVEFCVNGCENAVCQKSFFQKLWSFLSFWN